MAGSRDRGDHHHYHRIIIPFIGPFIGGFVAGYIAKRDIMNSGRAGLLAGALAAVVVFLVVFSGMASHPAGDYLQVLGTGFLMYIIITLYLAVFAFLRGCDCRSCCQEADLIFLITGAIREPCPPASSIDATGKGNLRPG
ncbi:MAG: hypothetical protein GKC07_09145 [Methanomicrobiales archaeon]|nr:hypothetical protein [Methanomicrobiales archaeon]